MTHLEKNMSMLQTRQTQHDEGVSPWLVGIEVDASAHTESLLTEGEDEPDEPDAPDEPAEVAPLPARKTGAVSAAEYEELLHTRYSGLRLKLSQETASAMVAGDVPIDATLAVRDFNFDLTQHIVPYTYQREGVDYFQSVTDQLHQFDTWLERCHKYPELLIVSSTPNDARAKALAAYVFAKALGEFNSDASMYLSRRISLPRWHQTFGGFNDSVVKEKREKKTESDPLLWVFSNVMDDSTSSKVENLRDSLQLYAHRPRIIVTSNGNPHAFSDRLRIAAAAHLFLR